MDPAAAAAGDQGMRKNRPGLGRRLSRRLSLVTRVPNLLGEKIRAEFSSRDTPRQNRRFELSVIAPDKTQKILTAVSTQRVWELVELLIAEYSVQEPQLRLAGSRAEVDPDVSADLLEGDILLVEEGLRNLHPLGETDRFYRETESFILDELEYVIALRSAGELFGSPLSRMQCFELEDHQYIFDSITDLANTCQDLAEQMRAVLDTWNPDTFKIGHLFSKQVWEQYDSYQDMLRKARQLLREKATDDDFNELCKLRRGAAKHTLQSLMELPLYISCVLFFNMHLSVELVDWLFWEAGYFELGKVDTMLMSVFMLAALSPPFLHIMGLVLLKFVP
ncbi:uncharacterized protein LOC142317703 [Lycorma delicatula]|uniref:uncharacterized protein LOC142317703 n=1 Tax=Lycorma delicatula TaxID=130591 RepID=UPI003F5119A6